MLNGDNAALIFVAAAFSVAGLGIGVLLGAWLGRIGVLEVLRTCLRLPLALLRSPSLLRDQWKLWGEWRARRKIERLRFRSQIKELKGKITAHQSGIRSTETEIRRARWKFQEPR